MTSIFECKFGLTYQLDSVQDLYVCKDRISTELHPNCHKELASDALSPLLCDKAHAMLYLPGRGSPSKPPVVLGLALPICVFQKPRKSSHGDQSHAVSSGSDNR